MCVNSSVKISLWKGLKIQNYKLMNKSIFLILFYAENLKFSGKQ